MRKVRVNITKYVSTEAGSRYCPAALTVNGKIKPDVVIVNGREERHPEGAYYLDWRTNGKRVRLSVGKNAQDALTQRDRKRFELNAAIHGMTVTPDTTPEVESNVDRRTLAEAAEKYLGDIKKHKSSKTLKAYATAIKYFRESCTKVFIDRIDRDDLLAFKTHLQENESQSDRSVWNKFSAVMGFLKSVGRSGKTMGVVKHDWPEYDEETPEVYTDSELKKFYAECDEEERRWFRFFELTGMREGEVQHCQWSWIEWGDMKEAWIEVEDGDEDTVTPTITVQPNQRLKWRPKKNKIRSIPMSEPLYDLLKEWRAKAEKNCDLVFPTSGCHKKMDFLDCLKRVAARADLFCGTCNGCTQKKPNCERWFLHKFRSTFGTKVLRKTDLRTAMEWLGHTDLKSTERYLRPAEGKEAQRKMAAVFGGGE